MNISIIVNPVFDGWSPWDVRVGGTEESVIEWATRLKQRGHIVRVFHNGRHGVFQGVDYLDRSDYPSVAGQGITLNCNYPDLPVYETTVYLNNLVDAAKYDLSKFKAVIHASHYSRASLGISHPNQEIVPHGYDPESIYYDPEEKIPKTVLYASSPDRGLSEIAKVWPEVIKVHDDALLIVTYNGEVDLPNTMCLGEVDALDMAALYRSSDIWCHPALGGELFGMTGIKAQVAKCWPVVYPTMALTETVRHATWSSPDTLGADLIEALSGHPTAPQEHFADWDESTDQLEAVLRKYA